MKLRQSLRPSSSTEDWRRVLGLAEVADERWDRVRAAQIAAVVAQLPARTAFGCALGALHVIGLYGTLPTLPLVLQGVAIVLFYLVSHRLLARLGRRTRGGAAARDLRKVAAVYLTGGAIWSGTFAWIALVGRPEQLILIWSFMLTLMTGVAIMMSAAPLGTFAFVGTCGLTATVVFLLLGQPSLAIAAVTVSGLLMRSGYLSSAQAIRDDTRRQELEERDETVSLLLREFEDAGADWLWETDTSRRLIHVSPRLARALGKEAREVEGKHLIETISGDAWETGAFPSALHDLAERLTRRDSFSDMLVPVALSSDTRWWKLSASPKLDESGNFAGFRGVGSDVTEQTASAKKIAHMARFDTLTGLPNRLQLNEALAEAVREAERWNGRYAFMMIDLDRFKAINDTLGHPVGDRLLAKVAERLQAVMEEGDLCGRLGGDEFAVVVNDATDLERVKRLAQRIIDTLSKPYEVDQHTMFIGASVGTAIGPRDGRTVETLIRSADLAMYRAKEEGGGRQTLYEPKLHAHAEERRVMEIALRRALPNDELLLHYQPVVSAETGGVLGFEALMRWNSPEFGMVPPFKFVPIAEDARLITAMGAWALKTACAEAMHWPSPVKVAVNVSADQLSDPDFMEHVVTALSSSGLPAKRLEIEVTESIFLNESAGVAAILDQLIAMGISLSLDDFGTGYSSLGYLRKTRFSTIKVDRSFVQGAAKRVPESLAIIRAVVAMADSLGMSTTAEGAETEEEVKMIQSLGCRKIQGYYFGRPMSDQAARELFRDPVARAGRREPEAPRSDAA